MVGHPVITVSVVLVESQGKTLRLQVAESRGGVVYLEEWLTVAACSRVSLYPWLDDVLEILKFLFSSSIRVVIRGLRIIGETEKRDSLQTRFCLLVLY